MPDVLPRSLPAEVHDHFPRMRLSRLLKPHSFRVRHKSPGDGANTGASDGASKVSPREWLQRLHFSRLPVMRCGLPIGVSDAVSEFSSLHHVSNPSAVVPEMLRVARKVVVVDCNRFAQGSLPARFLKLFLYKSRLWDISCVPAASAISFPKEMDSSIPTVFTNPTTRSRGGPPAFSFCLAARTIREAGSTRCSPPKESSLSPSANPLQPVSLSSAPATPSALFRAPDRLGQRCGDRAPASGPETKKRTADSHRAEA